MIRSLQDRIVQLGIEVDMEVTLTRLLKEGDRVVGAFGYNRVDGAFVAFKSKAVIMATGGWGRIYKVTSNSWEGTGDGVAMGFDAGAEVLDPEMVQFHPTGMVWPPGVRGILVTEAVRGEGGYLTNREGNRFMLEVDPKKKELSSRDVVARAIYKEVQAGRGTEHGGYPPRRRKDQEETSVDVRAISQAGRCRHHEGPHGSGADDPLRDGRSVGRGRDRSNDGTGPLCGR
jgi:succinate dehydrogenase / fumarate reductase flavoprotein subunit